MYVKRKFIWLSRKVLVSGVKRSIELCRKILEKHGTVFAVHPLVHNEIVMSDLAKHGLILEEDVEKIPSNSWVVLSAHVRQKMF